MVKSLSSIHNEHVYIPPPLPDVSVCGSEICETEVWCPILCLGSSHPLPHLPACYKIHQSKHKSDKIYQSKHVLQNTPIKTQVRHKISDITMVTIVADIQLAIVGNATMPLIDSCFYNWKSPMMVKNNLVWVNITQTHPKWQLNVEIVWIRNYRKHNLFLFHYQRCIYFLKKMTCIEH
jgi:hypothetical protein